MTDQKDMPKKVLLVEDEQDIIAMYKIKFEEYNFEFFSATNIADGWNQAKDHMPNVILLDIKLGDDNGMDLLKQLKENDATKGITVLMFSNAYQKENEQLGKDLGAEDFILKTKVLPDETIDIVNKYL